MSVDRSGISRLHVFRGKADLWLAGESGVKAETIPLLENQSARVEIMGGSHAAVVRDAGPPDRWVRHLPVQGSLGGRADQIEQLFAVDGDSGFKLGPSEVRAAGSYIPERNPSSVPIVLASIGARQVAGGLLYTFRTTFELEKDYIQSGATTVLGHFIAHDYVVAIRLNGVALPARTPVDESRTEQRGRFWLRQGLVAGTNQLEMDVVKRTPSGAAEDNLLQLRIEFALNRKVSPAPAGAAMGTGQQRQSGSRSPSGKEGAAMN
jgi:hypothetical protein